MQESEAEERKLQVGDSVRIKGQAFSPKYTITAEELTPDVNVEITFAIFGIYKQSFWINRQALVLA